MKPAKTTTTKKSPAPAVVPQRRLIGPWLQWLISLALAIASMFMVSGLTQLSGNSSGSAIGLTLVPGFAVMLLTRQKRTIFSCQWRDFGWWTIPLFLLIFTAPDYTLAVLPAAWLILFRRGLFLHNPMFDSTTGRFIKRTK